MPSEKCVPYNYDHARAHTQGALRDSFPAITPLELATCTPRYTYRLFITRLATIAELMCR